MSLRNIYHNLNKSAFWVCLLFSIGLITTSFFIPPLSVVDGSIIACVGELFAFATLGTVIEAISKGSDVTISHNNTNISINNPDKEE